MDSKLSFTKHIKEKISTARKGIGIIKHLATYLPLKTRDQIYKIFVRPHLDYCDVIYHTPVISNDYDSSQTLCHQMNTLERTQYHAALAVSGAWKGTNRNKIYEQLGWESLDQRRTFRRLTQFYKIMLNLTPGYLKTPIPLIQPHLFGYRGTNVLRTIFCRTVRYGNSFFPDSVNSWNNLGPELRGAPSLSIFKKNLLKIIRPEKRSIFNIFDHKGISWIFQLRVGLSSLKCHKKFHNFLDTPDDICQCTLSSESTNHFLLKCPLFDEHRTDLFRIVNPILVMNNIALNDDEIVHLLLYGHEKLNLCENKNILKATINFINKTLRFSTF